MMTHGQKPIGKSEGGFTLLELLVALSMFAMLASAMYSVFSTALRLREQGFRVIENQQPSSAALDVIRRDLQGVMTTGTLAGPFIGLSANSAQGSSDQLEFYTTSGIITDRLDSPWSELQRVTYELENPRSNTGVQGMELVRMVQRNLLSPTEDEPVRQRLLSGVKSFRVDYFYDQTWINTWDSTNNGIPPQVVKVRIDFVQPENQFMSADQQQQAQEAPRRPLSLVVEPFTRLENTTASLGMLDMTREDIQSQNSGEE